LTGDAGDNEIDPGLSSGKIDAVSRVSGNDVLVVDYSIQDVRTGITGGFQGDTSGFLFRNTSNEVLSIILYSATSLLDGGEGRNIASYRTSLLPIYLDLKNSPLEGFADFGTDAVGDVLISIEQIEGSSFGDILYQFSEIVLQIQSPEALQILGLAIQNRQSEIQN